MIFVITDNYHRMAHLKTLLNSVASARLNFIQTAANLTYEQSQFRISPESWSTTDIVEHMVWAEMGGINGIWKTLEGIKSNRPVWSGESIHHGLRIEQIIDKTWKEKEQVPENAKPKWGGSLGYWIAALRSCQPLLESLARELNGHDLEKIIYPHVISGPLNVIQRMEFLRFHLDRHRKQIENIKAHSEFPSA
jgi:hypothetical protein